MRAIKGLLIIVALAAFVAALVLQGPSDFVAFAKRLVTTWWGALNLLVFLLLLWAWVWQKGTAFFVVLFGLLAAIAYGGPFSTEVTRLVGESPASWFLSIMTWSAGRWATAAYGILILAAALTVALVPPNRTAIRHARILQSAGLNQFSDFAEIQNAYQRRGEAFGSGPLLGSLALGCVGGAMIMLWVALRWFADSGLPLGMPALRMPDLTVPNFRPVWELAYFGLAVAVMLGLLIQAAVLKRFDITVLRPGLIRPAGVIIAALAMALVVPAGVMVYLLAGAVALALLVPVLVVGQSRYGGAAQRSQTRHEVTREREGRGGAASDLGGSGLAAVLGSGSGSGGSPSSDNVADPFGLLEQLGIAETNDTDRPKGNDRLAEIVGAAPSTSRSLASASGSVQTGRTCTAITKSGKRCKNAAIEGSDRCRLHQRH